MKHLLLTTIAALLLVGCGNPDISLLEAAKEGDVEVTKKALAEGADLNAEEEKDGLTPLHNAAWEGHKEVIELLIANGADLNAKNWGGE
jgi:ankyrin repeat protein